MAEVTDYEVIHTMLKDAFIAVHAIYGDEGLLKVSEHMKLAARTREQNAYIDELEKILP